MTIVINGSGTITGISQGGLNDNIITQSELVTGVAGTGPAFSAYASAGTSCNNGAATKIAINTEEFDTASCFDNATNFRLTPNVPGYYKVTGYVSCGSTTGCYVAIFKNGSEFKRGSQSETSAPMVGYVVDSLIYFNGSTDYAELYFYNGSGSAKTTNGGASLTYFQAALVRAA